MDHQTLSAAHDTATRLARLTKFLKRDPLNFALLLDAAHTAFDAAQHSQALEWLLSADALSPLSAFDINLLGSAALAVERLDIAERAFGRLLMEFPNDEAAVHDYAFTLSLQSRYQEALNALDGLAVPQSASSISLRIRLLHFLGKTNDAIALAEAAHAETTNEEIGSTLAPLYLDANRLRDAESIATKYPSRPECATTMGIIQLLRAQPDMASSSFARALASNGRSGRALLGAGLAAFSALNFSEATDLLERAAISLKTHPGAWLAVAWCHLLTGNIEAAESRLEEARRLDRNFAETHGSIAVLRWITGDRASAMRLSTIASSLDPNSFSAKLVQSFQAEIDHGPNAGAAIRAQALQQPVLPENGAIAPLLAAYFPSISLDTLGAATAPH
jgi:tetratricopeptide (TPR) repeat protein